MVAGYLLTYAPHLYDCSATEGNHDRVVLYVEPDEG